MSVQPAAEGAAIPNVDAGSRAAFFLEATIKVLDQSDLPIYLAAMVQQALDQLEQEIAAKQP